MRVFNLAPGPDLPPDLQARRLGRLLDAKSLLRAGLTQVGQALRPLVQETSGNQHALAGQDGALEARELVGGQGRDPAADDVLGVGGLVDGHDAVGVEDGLDLHAGPDVVGQVGDDARGDLLLQLAQRLAVLLDVVHDVLGRPAQQRVGFQIAHAQLQDGGADALVALGVGELDVVGAGGERGHGDVVGLEGLLGAEEEVPLEGDGGGELVLGGGDGEGFLVGGADGARVEEDLQAVFALPHVDVVPEALLEGAGLRGAGAGTGALGLLQHLSLALLAGHALEGFGGGGRGCLRRRPRDRGVRQRCGASRR